uniref:Uncharacterized protein n=1 Tax=viral metagenome TaxID=1070528 RepID=A0A6C0DMT1_9ZZZZ
MDVTKPFSKILAFVNELNRNFGNKHKNLGLYYIFLKEKTPLSNKKAISKQNEVFKKFLENNREAVLNMDIKLLKDENIAFSEKVYINLKQLLKENKDSVEVIFKHLQLISALLLEDNTMIEALKEDKESKFLDKYVSKIDELFKDTNGVEDPMAAAMSLLQSGALSDMTKELKDGKLNVGKLISSLQEKMKTTASEIGTASQTEEASQIPNVLDTLMKDPSSLLKDPSSLMNMASGLMGNMDEDTKVNMMNMVGGLMKDPGSFLSGEGAGDLAGIASSLIGGMDEDAKVNMMNMVGGLMSGGDLAGMLGGLMKDPGSFMNGEGDLASSLGGMVTSMLSGGGDNPSTNLADMLANMTTVEEVPETTTTEETPQ